MKMGKVKAAIKFLASSEASILSIHDKLQTTDTQDSREAVLAELKAKQPPKHDVNPDIVLSGHERDFHPVIFDCLDVEAIHKTALKTQGGGAGPSGADANFWKRICNSFQTVSDDLCASMTLVAKKISTSYVDLEGLSAFTACRLMALDKQQGVKAIGIGDVVRRIVSKAILGNIRDEIMEVAGTTHQTLHRSGSWLLGWSVFNEGNLQRPQHGSYPIC